MSLRLTFNECALKLCSLAVIVLLAAVPANAEEAARDEKPTEIPAISLWVDMGLGLISEKAAQDKMEVLGIDFKPTLEKEVEAMTGHLYGVRLASGKQFAALIDKMDGISSFYSFTVIGTTAKRAYLEANYHLTSEFGYVAIVSASLEDLPAETLKKVLALRHRGK